MKPGSGPLGAYRMPGQANKPKYEPPRKPVAFIPGQAKKPIAGTSMSDSSSSLNKSDGAQNESQQ